MKGSRTFMLPSFFLFPLKGDARAWYDALPCGSSQSPQDMAISSVDKYFPAHMQHAALQRIYNFKKLQDEHLPKAWGRFCSLLKARPGHGIPKNELLDIFYAGLTDGSKSYLDSCAGCVFRQRTPDDAEELMGKIAKNHEDWSMPEPPPPPKNRGMLVLSPEDMQEAKKSIGKKGLKVKMLRIYLRLRSCVSPPLTHLW